jgi:flagellar biogenesis protein FliO
MKRKITDFFKLCGLLLVILAFVWLVTANVVFKFRHPWATETETLLNIKSMVLFQKVPYSEMRPRD